MWESSQLSTPSPMMRLGRSYMRSASAQIQIESPAHAAWLHLPLWMQEKTTCSPRSRDRRHLHLTSRSDSTRRYQQFFQSKDCSPASDFCSASPSIFCTTTDVSLPTPQFSAGVGHATFRYPLKNQSAEDRSAGQGLQAIQAHIGTSPATQSLGKDTQTEGVSNLGKARSAPLTVLVKG